MFTAFAYNVTTNERQRQKFAGPPSFQTWKRSCTVLRTTFLLLQAVSAEPLDLYGKLVRKGVQASGSSCWWIVYPADVSTWSKEFERQRLATKLRTAHAIRNRESADALGGMHDPAVGARLNQARFSSGTSLHSPPSRLPSQACARR
eukprot:11184321-Lingulodinium_polyedra.AAC.2